MGASSGFLNFESTDREQVQKEFSEYRQECLYEYGHNAYSGSFATLQDTLIFNSREFTDVREAEDYILNNTEKWGNAMACTIKEEGKEPYTLVGGWLAK